MLIGVSPPHACVAVSSSTPPLDARPAGTHSAHPIPARVLAYLHTHSPAKANQIASHIGAGLTTVLYHLRQLERRGRLSREGRHWLVAEACSPDALARATLSRGARNVLGLLQEASPLDHSAVAAHLQVTNGAVTAFVKELTAKGLVTVERRGRRKLLSLPNGSPAEADAAPAASP